MNTLKIKKAHHSFLILLIYSLAALTSANASDNDLTRLLPKQCVFYGNFFQTRNIERLPSSLNSSGNFFFSCERGIIWQTLYPIKSSLIYTTDGTSFEGTHEKNSQQTSFTSLNGTKHYYLGKFLINLLSANLQELHSDFDATHTTPPPNNTLAILLTPKNEKIKKSLKNITLKRQENESTLLITINNNESQTNIKIDTIENTTTHKSTLETCKLSLKNNIEPCDPLFSPHNFTSNALN